MQQPGLTVADSKSDLVVDPVGWLQRAAHVWYPDSTFGQLQNQAYGYFWPMGPFFAGGHVLGIPPWVVQRLWWALLMCVAFSGVVALAGRLRIGTPTARLIAGVAFALSPRLLTEMGAISVEAWPSAVAPWVLVPLAGLRRGASLRAAVTRSAIAVVCAGGANATAVLAVVPLALLLLATLQPLRRRILAIVAWCVAIGCATAWWLVPLLVLGRYSPPFLDYIETAQVTTRVTDSVAVMRGASHWLGYYADAHGPAWSAGWRLATEPLLVAATLAVTALGVAGLARRGMPHRRFLITGLLVGLALVGLGHIGSVDGIAADLQRQFLDHAGAPLRNVHKFDVVLRLPLVLGMAHLLGAFQRSAAVAGTSAHPARRRAIAVTVAAVGAIAVAATPALAGGLPVRGSYATVPAYWRDASQWLDKNLDHEHVLVVPAARFPQYRWGGPTDEITQSLMRGGWGVRNAIPLTPPTTVRLLDAIESVLANGAGSPGLADLLARSGVRYLLVRSDLNYGASGAARPLLVHQALERSPGMRSVAGFGPEVGGDKLLGSYVDQGLDVPVRAIEVFEVEQAVDRVVAYEARDVTTVVGGPESLLELAAAGQLPPAPTVLAGDLGKRLEPGRVAVTDGLRRREVAFGLPYDSTSSTQEASERPRLGAPAADFLPAWGDDQTTVVRYEGVQRVSASSSWGQANWLSGTRPAHHAFAALDRDPATSWRSAPGSTPAGQWLEVELAEPRKLSQLRLRVDLDADVWPTRVSVSAGAESATADVVDGVADVRLPGNVASKRVRVVIDAAVATRIDSGTVGIAELEIPGVTAERTLVVPAPPNAGTVSTVVASAAPSAASCFFLSDSARCAEGVSRGSEDGQQIDRTVTLPQGGRYTPTLSVRPRPGPQLNELLDRQLAGRDKRPTVTASSTRLPDPAARAGAIFDGSPSTAWQPAVGDPNPWLRLAWQEPHKLTGLRFTLPPELGATRPDRVQVVGDNGILAGKFNLDGVFTFDQPLTTRTLTVLFSAGIPMTSYDPYSNRRTLLPIGVGELAVLPSGTSRRAQLDDQVTVPCGEGPSLRVGGIRLETTFTATLRELLELREVPARVCLRGDGTVPVDAGESHLMSAATDVVTPVRIALTHGRPTSPQAGTPVRIDKWSTTQRQLQLDPHPVQRVLALRENTNPGWRATAAGKTLVPIVVDGWQQGWVVPAGVGGPVVLSFTPDTPYRTGLVAGAGLVAGVLLLAVLPTRRSNTVTPVPSRRERRRRWLLAAVGGVALLVFGGTAAIGLVIVGVIMVVGGRRVSEHLSTSDRWRWERARRSLRWLLPVAFFAVAGWQSMTVAEPHTAAAPQLAVLATLVALWLSVAMPARGRGTTVPPRRVGAADQR
ncbi:alpha-(1-_3)-arabinofuranosyltransferase [Micromonospora sp. NPDC049679]|uniref:alpha-(1->3)-arabinofuranosyltransferase n=1 Tax=Micromonospora sp. NPDC049679 TaxID=3155920 RepID=UPI0033D64A06